MRFWAGWILYVPGIRVKVYNKEFLDKIKTPCVFIANHHSYLDIVVSYFTVSQYFIFLGKAELRNAPLFNIFFREMNILVDRNKKSSAGVSYTLSAQRIDNGESVFLFPEGGISPNGKLIPFKNGAFRLAIEKQVQLVPITFKNNFKLLQNGGFLKVMGRPGIAEVVIHEPIDTTGMTLIDQDLLNLKFKTYDIIQKPLLEENGSR